METISDSASAIDGFGSPQSRRVRGGRFSSPWSHVVRGGEAEAIPATSPPLDADREKDSNSPEASAAVAAAVAADLGESAVAAKAKRPAWNKPSNGVVEIGSLMGGSWPALSESARSSPKSSSDSLKALADGSASASAPASAPALQGTVVLSSPQKLILNSSNTNSSSSTTPKKSGKRGGTSNNGGFQSVPSIETSHNNSDKPATVGMDSSPRASSQKNNYWEATSRVKFNLQQPHAGVDHPRCSYRRGNGGGPHPRGNSEGGYHGNYGSRLDQDRQNYEWNTHQSFSGRDIHMRQQRTAPRSFARHPPPTPPPFPLHVQPYASAIGFPDLRSQLYYVPAPPPESLSGVVPFVAHAAPPGMFISTPDPQLRSMLVKQIDYYFSPENLCKDIFLRQNMDEQGWVPISLIASFNRVKQLTMYIPFILDAVRTSTVVQVQGDKIRKQNDWMNWLLPPPNLLGTAVTGPPSPNYESLSTRMQSIGLEGITNHNSQRALVDSHAEGILTRSLSVEPSNRLQGSMPAGHAEMVHTSNQMGSDRSISLTSLEKSVSC